MMNEITIFVKNEFMIKTVIATDALQLLERVTKMVKTCCPNLTVVASVDTVKAGVAAINKHDPDIVILDTKLSDGSGFDLVRHFSKPDFKIIFLSSSIDYAVKAIKFNAIDYLIKPVEEDELAVALNKAADMIRYEENMQQQALGEGIRNLNTSQRLVIKTSDQMYVVNVDEIVRVEASSNYSIFYMDDGRKIMVSKALKEYEELLFENSFHRIHKSHMFNINKMSHFDKIDGGFVVMSDGSRIPVASRKREMLLHLFDDIK
ncbi:MAG: response regulator transcription factor [Chlamydiia bacterium]|nr:response regulator transcription factor [Chlamydiia bacterium]